MKLKNDVKCCELIATKNGFIVEGFMLNNGKMFVMREFTTKHDAIVFFNNVVFNHSI